MRFLYAFHIKPCMMTHQKTNSVHIRRDPLQKDICMSRDLDIHNTWRNVYLSVISMARQIHKKELNIVSQHCLYCPLGSVLSTNEAWPSTCWSKATRVKKDVQNKCRFKRHRELNNKFIVAWNLTSELKLNRHLEKMPPLFPNFFRHFFLTL